MTDAEDVFAGNFSSWLAGLEDALRGERDSEVPCDGCTACCTSSQFVHIGPDERDALAHIPAGVLFPAPGLPPGHMLLGYDERGHCPMFQREQCSIYDHRPRTCRTYDCRVFPAAGIEPEDKPEIARRARRWRFEHPSEADRSQHDAVRAAATYLQAGDQGVPAAAVPTTPTGLAVLAVEVHAAFLGQPQRDHDDVRALIVRRTRRPS